MSGLYPVKCPFCFEDIESVLGKSVCAMCGSDITVVKTIGSDEEGQACFHYSTLEGLKKNWIKDSCWDIEDTEGFEAYHDELLEWRKVYDSERAEKLEQRNKARAEQIFKQTGVSDVETASALSTWSEIEQDLQIGIKRTESDLDVLVASQVRATLLLAAQVKRVADELKEMRLHGLIVGQA